MTYSDTQPRGTLRYRLLSASLLPSSSPLTEPGSWGHEYVRHLAAELGEEYNLRETADLDIKPTEAELTSKGEGEEDTPEAKPFVPLPGTIDDLRSLAIECAKFLLAHNAEPDAVDLLEELEIVDRIVELVDENTFARVCQYMDRCVSFLVPPDDISFLQTIHGIYVRHSKFPEALATAIRLGDRSLIRSDFQAPANP
jgi:26S proteasome regulatory subunit N1